MRKRYQVKIYDLDGTYRKTLSPKIVKNNVTFTSLINGGQGVCVLDLALPIDDFGEGDYIDHMKVMRIYQVDEDNSVTPRLIYTGWVSQYEPYFSAKDEGVRVNLLGLASLLSLIYYYSGSYTHTPSADPSVIATNIIDYLNTKYSGGWLSHGANVSTVGVTVGYDFDYTKCLDAVKKAHELSDGDWWWHIGADGELYFKDKPNTATHLFIKGSHIHEGRIRKKNEKVVNKYILEYNGGAGTYEDATSQTAYGLRELNEDDQNISGSTTADQQGDKKIADEKDPKAHTTLIINSSYDIESIKVGDTCTVTNFKKDTSPLPSNLQIVSIRYSPEFATLELGDANANFQREFTEAVAKLTS